MVRFGTMYVAASEIRMIYQESVGGNYNITLELKSGVRFTVPYALRVDRDAEFQKLAASIDTETRKFEIQFFRRTDALEAILDRIEKRQLKIQRVLKGNLSPESLED